MKVYIINCLLLQGICANICDIMPPTRNPRETDSITTF